MTHKPSAESDYQSTKNTETAFEAYNSEESYQLHKDEPEILKPKRIIVKASLTREPANN